VNPHLFHLDAYPDPGSQTNADPDPGPKKLNFYMKNILDVGNMSKNIPSRYENLFERQETSFNCQFLSIMLLDPDPHSKNGSGSSTTHINADPDPQQSLPFRRSIRMPMTNPVLWIRDVYPGSGFLPIPDPDPQH
jgi:hypothetical protein